jgi:plastocyanin
VRTRQKMLRAAAITAGAGALALPLAAPASDDPVATKAGKAVGVTGTSAATYAYSPSTVTIKAGGKVTFSWSGKDPHSATFSSGKSSPTAAKVTFTRRFTAPGKFPFHCVVHGHTGKVVVKPV